jgi:hypothetical protein
LPAPFKVFEKSIGSLAIEILRCLKTRNNQYYFFIKKGLIGSEKTIDLTCMCGTRKDWQSPHEQSNLYCKNCGSHFNLLEVDGGGGYIITSDGPVKVIGSDVPDFHDLPIEDQMRLMKDAENMMRRKMDS